METCERKSNTPAAPPSALIAQQKSRSYIYYNPFTSHKISEVPDLIPVSLFHQKELAIASERLFNGAF